VPLTCSSSRISWDAVPNATGYSVRRDGVGINNVSTTFHTYVDTGLTTLHVYNYVVYALDAQGALFYPQSGPITMPACTTPNPNPVTISLTGIRDKQIVTGPLALSAETTGPVNSVRYFIDGKGISFFLPSPPYSFSYDSTLLSSSIGDHTLTAVAYNDQGAVASTSPITIKVLNGPGIAAAPQLSAQASGSQVNLTWQIASSNTITKFNVEQATSAAGPFIEIAQVPATARSFVNKGIFRTGQTYYYRITAYTSPIIKSDYSNVVSANPTSPTDPLQETLIVYNTASADSVYLKDYYLAHRPGASQMNLLGITTNGGEIISQADYAAQIKQPIQDWMVAHPSQPIEYIVFMYDVPDRIVSSPSVSVQLSRDLGFAPGNDFIEREYKPANVSETNTRFYSAEFPGTAVLVSYINTSSSNATKIYIDKIASGNFSSGYISGGALSGSTYYLDDLTPLPQFASYHPALETKMSLLNANSSASIIYQDTTHIIAAKNVAGYQTWGQNGGQGGDYPTDGSVVFSGNSSWYVIKTIESYNGQRTSYQGNVAKWFSQNAFGSKNYEFNPVGAVAHTDEPGYGGINNSAFFSSWDRGNPLIEAAWSTRKTDYFMTIGDPFLKK
jgi:hypothetical protein